MSRGVEIFFLSIFLVWTGCGDGSSDKDVDAAEDTEVTDPAVEEVIHDLPAEDQPSDPVADEPAPDVTDVTGEEAHEVVDDPEIEDTVEEEPEPACYQAGCVVPVDEACCEGLVRDEDCLPGDTCSGEEFCISCGDSVCGAHENLLNCPGDCDEQCDGGYSETVTCPEAGYRCACKEPDCIPECLHVGTRSEGWYHTCEGEERLIDWAFCDGQTAECRAITSRSEGWYESGSGELIEWAFCHNTWECM